MYVCMYIDFRFVDEKVCREISAKAVLAKRKLKKNRHSSLVYIELTVPAGKSLTH